MRILVFCLMAFTSFTYSQNCSLNISGQVIDLHDNSPLFGAVVQIESLNKVVYTNEKGHYKIEDICEGLLEIKVSHPFCEPKTKSLNLKSNTEINFRLEHHLEELNEVLLKGKLYNNENNSSISNQIKTETLEEFSNASLGDALKNISGVSSLNTGNAIVKPIIQGLHSSRVLVINDNVRLHDQQWGVDHAPNVDINSAANITVIKGASALKYGGDAVGGTIVVEPKKAPIKDTLIGKTIVTGATNGRGGTLASNLIKAYNNGFNYRIQGSLKRLGDFKSPDYQLSNTGSRANNLSLGLGLNKIDYGIDFSYKLTDSEIGILRASHIGNTRDLVNAINRQTPSFVDDFSYDINNPKQKVTHQIYKLKAFKKLKNIGELSLQYAFQNNRRKEFDVRRGGRSDLAALDLELKTHTILAELEWDQTENFDSNFGVEFNAQNNFPNPRTGVRRLIPDYEMLSFGTYATSLFQLSDTWEFDAGIRYDFSRIDAVKYYITSRWEDLNYDETFPQFEVEYIGNQIETNPKFDYHNFSATFGATHQLSEQMKLIMNLSSASRAPNPSELFSDGLHHSISSIERGDLSLSPEQSYKFGVGFQGSYKNFGFNFQPYANFINNYILMQPEDIERTIRGAFPVYQYSQTNARLLGFDLTANYKFQKLDFRTNLAYIHGEDMSNNEALIDMPPTNWSNTVRYEFDKFQNLYLELNSQFVFKQNRFPNNNFEVEILNTETGTFEDVLVDISTPPEAYHLLNFSSGMDFKLDKTKFNINLRINNLFNTNYRNYLNRQRYYADEIGTNVMLQLKVNY